MTDLDQFLSVEEAARRSGLTARALKRRRDLGELTLYQDPRDRRRRLVQVADLERLATPNPITRRQDRPDAASAA
jgi:hypothetical protein